MKVLTSAERKIRTFCSFQKGMQVKLEAENIGMIFSEKVQASTSYIMKFILKMVLVVFCSKIGIESVVYDINCVLVVVRNNMHKCKLQELRMKMGRG